MIKYLFLLLCLGATLSSISQNANEFYRKADSLFKVKDYRGAAVFYANGIRSEGQQVAVGRYRSTASAWALAGEKDSAFHYLDMISTSGKVNKVIARNIEFGEEFIFLNKDKRWLPGIDRINKQAELNGYPQDEFIYGRKDGMALTLVRIRPKIKSNNRGIVYVISGSWFSSYNGIEVPTANAEQFLAKGYTVFAVMHGSQPRYAIPDAVNDIQRAVKYIRFNAAKLGIDPNHIGITGNSAGGHLSLMTALRDDQANPKAPDPVDRVSSRVQAVAVLYPPTDLLNWGTAGIKLVNEKEILKVNRTWGAVDFKIWNDRYALYEEVSDTAMRNKIGREISPINFVSKDDPPVFIIHGDADLVVPLQQSQILITTLNESGVENRFIIKKGGRHSSETMNPEWQEFAAWFDKHLRFE